MTNKEESEEENIYNEELVRQRFVSSIDAYKDYVLNIHDKNKQNAGMNDAMMAFTKTLNKSLKCTPSTIQKQMHEFGKGTVGNSRTKNGRVITVNPPALSRRSFKVPGRGSARIVQTD